MPIFPGAVRHNNEDAAILDLTKNQVVGIGVFDVIGTSAVDEARDDLHANLRTKGYTATVRYNSTTYVYTSDAYDDDSWTNTNNWSIIGGSALPDGIDIDDVLTYNGSDAAWQNTVTTKKVTIKNHATNPGASEIVFSRKDTDGSTLQGDILGEISAEGFSIGGVTRTGNPSIKFVSSGASSTSAFLESNIQFYVSNPNGTQKSFELSSDRKVVLASIEDVSIPTVVLGGIYYNSSQDNYYVGKNA